MARPRQVTNEQILGTMRTCVLERGPKVSLDTVAERLGVTAPALLRRFGTRDQLMLEALRPPLHPAPIDLLKKGPSGQPLAAQLEGVFVVLWDFFADVVPCATALRESGVPREEIFRLSQGMMRLVDELSAWLGRTTNKGLTEPRGLDTAATAMLGAVQARVFSAHLAQESFDSPSHRRYLKDLAQLFARALAKKRKKLS